MDARGDRIAYGSPGCPEECHGPITVLSVPSGNVVARIGGSTPDNTSPSVSPNGRRVVFSGTRRLWTASTTGGRLRRPEQCRSGALWSPDGDRIAYLDGPGGLSLLVVSLRTGKRVTRALRRPGQHVTAIAGWSPDAGASPT